MKEVYLRVMYIVLVTSDEGGVTLANTEKCTKTGQTQTILNKFFIYILRSE